MESPFIDLLSGEKETSAEVDKRFNIPELSNPFIDTIAPELYEKEELVESTQADDFKTVNIANDNGIEAEEQYEYDEEDVDLGQSEFDEMKEDNLFYDDKTVETKDYTKDTNEKIETDEYNKYSINELGQDEINKPENEYMKSESVDDGSDSEYIESEIEDEIDKSASEYIEDEKEDDESDYEYVESEMENEFYEYGEGESLVEYRIPVTGSLVNVPVCKIDPFKKNKINFEFDMLLNITSDLKLSRTLDDGIVISEHTKSGDGFISKIDGNKIEVNTKRFKLSAKGLTELKRTFANIGQWLKNVEVSLQAQKKIVKIEKDPACVNCIAGEGIFIDTQTVGRILRIKDELISKNHFIFPLRNAVSVMQNYYTDNRDIKGVPQVTMCIPLARVSKLADLIRSTQGRGIGVGLTGSSGMRQGLRSDALFNAQYRVNVAREYFLKKGIFDSLKIDNKNFSDTLTGFLILLAQYFWTSVLPDDPRDREIFSKAYVPLHSKTRFREMFHCLLNDPERELFLKVFWENENWKNLFSLAKKIDGRKGGYSNINDTPNIRLFSRKVSVLKPTWKEFVTSIVENSFSIEKPSGANTLVTGPTNAIKLTTNGVYLELRRMGFDILPSENWLDMAEKLFNVAKNLNN